MTKLKEEILQAILEYELGRVSDYDINTSQIKEYSKVVEEVCLKWLTSPENLRKNGYQKTT